MYMYQEIKLLIIEKKSIMKIARQLWNIYSSGTRRGAIVGIHTSRTIYIFINTTIHVIIWDAKVMTTFTMCSKKIELIYHLSMNGAKIG